MSPELQQNLQVAGIVGLVGVVWRLGNQVARQNGNVAAVMRDLAKHEKDCGHLFERIFDRLERRRGWFRRD